MIYIYTFIHLWIVVAMDCYGKTTIDLTKTATWFLPLRTKMEAKNHRSTKRPVAGAFQVIAALLAKAAVSVIIYKSLGTHWNWSPWVVWQ